MDSLSHVLARAAVAELRLRKLVAHRREGDPAPDDPFKGLYLNDEELVRLLEGRPEPPAVDRSAVEAVERDADAAEAAGAVLRLRRLQRSAGLTPLDVELLLVALLPDLDSRYERLYGYLNDDVTRRRPSVGLALELVGAQPVDARARARLAAGGPLVDARLVRVEDEERPVLTRSLRVPDRVTAHLLGDDVPDPAVASLLQSPAPWDGEDAGSLAAAIGAGSHLLYVREDVPGTGMAVGAAALTRARRPALCLDLGLVAAEPSAERAVLLAGREAMLCGGGLVAGPVEALAREAPPALRLLVEAPVPVVLVGTTPWDPAWGRTVPVLAGTPTFGLSDRVALWRAELEARRGTATRADGGEVASASRDPAALVAHFVLGPAQVIRAVQAAEAAAVLTGGELTAEGVRRGARAQNAAGLERLSRRIEPDVGWSDLVLPPAVSQALRDLAARARHRDQVLSEWRMRRGGGRGRGITALFAGDSGTGKTMSAEVIAGDLGLDLYAVNLATVVDKYVGETEKNLERIFSEASGVNAVLLFDEADAIFGKRSEVRDAHDRYANIESAYLLQRMETFDGLAVLATNLRANIDDAFTRRLDAIVDFPPPDADLRLALWQRCLAPPLPLGDDLDLDFCAKSFELSGGNIRSVALTAAYRAAEQGRPVAMADLVTAVQQEYRKLGRLVHEREFGGWLARLR
jgi:ATPase family associated with various cellular activities (AAA)